jgi:hypothetical protein
VLLTPEKIDGPAHNIVCDSNEQAVSLAADYLRDGNYVEIWQRARMVRRLRADKAGHAMRCALIVLCAVLMLSNAPEASRDGKCWRRPAKGKALCSLAAECASTGKTCIETCQ